MHREMRRKDRLITDQGWMEEVLNKGLVLQLGLSQPDGFPYIVPLSYGYKEGSIYLHGASSGLKCDLIKMNPKVCFQVHTDAELVRHEKPEEFTMKYKSVTGFGIAHVLEDREEKEIALNILMDHFQGPHLVLGEKSAHLWVVRVDIKSMTGKMNGYPRPETESMDG